MIDLRAAGLYEGVRRGACVLAVLLCAGCGNKADPPPAGPNVVVQKYLDAIAKGDGPTACGLLSRKGYKNGGYTNRAACVRDYSGAPSRLGQVKVVSIHFDGPQSATVEVGDAAVSDSGNDSIALTRSAYGQWLIDAG